MAAVAATPYCATGNQRLLGRLSPYNNADLTPGLPERNYGSVTHQVLIHDARGKESNFTLDKDAFQLLLNQPPSAEKDFTDDASIKANYYPRSSSSSSPPYQAPPKSSSSTTQSAAPPPPRAPVTRVHIDQTAPSTIQRIHRHSSPSETPPSSNPATA
ncbi:hypothetical protein N0V88_000388 [Collariella sp. IMI 366227]|nr:hypothetical protein N0V88_000388 [Collariella sp. IMI 366227]